MYRPKFIRYFKLSSPKHTHACSACARMTMMNFSISQPGPEPKPGAAGGDQRAGRRGARQGTRGTGSGPRDAPRGETSAPGAGMPQSRHRSPAPAAAAASAFERGAGSRRTPGVPRAPGSAAARLLCHRCRPRTALLCHCTAIYRLTVVSREPEDVD